MLQLKQIDREHRLLGHTSAILQWDQETYMPRAAVQERAEQLSLLSGLMHDRITRPDVGESLSALGVDFEADPVPRVPDRFSEIERAFLREMARVYHRSSRIPRRVATELAKQTAIGQRIWVEARKAADFSRFSGQLDVILDLVREVSASLGYEDHPYDPLLDEFEPGMKTSEVDGIFAQLRTGLKDLLDRILGSDRQVDIDFLHRSFDVQKQRSFGFSILESIGYDFSRGRLDESAHPFTTTLGGSDVRLTTRYNEHFLPSSIFGTIHECGHGLYELGFGDAVQGSLLAECPSLGLHESQSRMWENLIGRSDSFWRHFYPRLRSLFPEALGDVEPQRFYEAVNRVAPSFIRVEADEATYNLHILLRFELEKQLVGGELAVQDLPEAWNAQMRELLDLTPPDDARGLLQDVHWSGGMIGYFPTYSLGNLYAAQFFATMARDIPDWRGEVEAGCFESILDWLRRSIHTHGRIYPARDLCQRVTGESLNPRFLLEYLGEKYGAIYGF